MGRIIVTVNALNTVDLGEMELEGSLNSRQLQFVNQYMVDSNATQAAIRAGYSEHTASSIGSQLLSNLKVRRAIEERLRDAAAAASVSAESVIAELRDLAFADASELQELIVRPCSKCWPAGLTFDDPNPLCDSPVIMADLGNLGGCGGAGVMIVKMTPTRKLSRRTAKLISAIRQKKDGTVEFEMRSQDKALEMLGRARGVFKDVREHTGPGGAPIALTGSYQPGQAKQMDNDQLEALVAQIAESRGMLGGSSGGSSQVIEGNPQDVKELPADSAPYVPVTGESEA